jgi:hypothetical protein
LDIPLPIFSDGIGVARTASTAENMEPGLSEAKFGQNSGQTPQSDPDFSSRLSLINKDHWSAVTR